MAGGQNVAHDFGGAWTEIKLDVVQYYLQCYTSALSHTKFQLWYIDAFAGTGSRDATRLTGGLLEGRPSEIIVERLAGSARRALSVAPPFHNFVFVEKDPLRRQALGEVKTEHPSKNIDIIAGDANEALRTLTELPLWRRGTAGPVRGVVFLDPYSLQVDWATLEALAATEVLDVWYLFPLRDITRQLSLKISGIGPKDKKLDQVLSPAWRDLYSMPEPSNVQNMFDLFAPAEELERKAKFKQIEEWFQGRLRSIFSHVSEPLPLRTAPTRQAFSLFLCVANPNGRAIELAAKFERYAMKQDRSEASRRKSGR